MLEDLLRSSLCSMRGGLLQLGLGRVQTQVGVLTFLSLLPVLTGEGVRWPDVIFRFYFLFPALDQMLTEPRFPQTASLPPGWRTHPFQRCSREQALWAGTHPSICFPRPMERRTGTTQTCCVTLGMWPPVSGPQGRASSSLRTNRVQLWTEVYLGRGQVTTPSKAGPSPGDLSEGGSPGELPGRRGCDSHQS